MLVFPANYLCKDENTHSFVIYKYFFFDYLLAAAADTDNQQYNIM